MITIVAELGINHGGDPDVACEMIRAAALCGCDAVKVQSFKASDFLRDDDPDWDLIESCEIWPFLPDLADVAHREKLLFGVTPQVASGVSDAVSAGSDYLKVASECITQHGLIQACLDTGLPTWVSTGMASWWEVAKVPAGARLMLCTSLYPCPDDQANLARRFQFNFEGFSDHTEGIEAAVAMTLALPDDGMIEKHFTLDRNADGPDHSFSSDPAEMRRLVETVRRVEVMRGSSEFVPPSTRNLIAEGQLRA